MLALGLAAVSQLVRARDEAKSHYVAPTRFDSDPADGSRVRGDHFVRARWDREGEGTYPRDLPWKVDGLTLKRVTPANQHHFLGDGGGGRRAGSDNNRAGTALQHSACDDSGGFDGGRRPDVERNR